MKGSMVVRVDKAYIKQKIQEQQVIPLPAVHSDSHLLQEEKEIAQSTFW